jgi:hypothetical protein
VFGRESTEEILKVRSDPKSESAIRMLWNMHSTMARRMWQDKT